MGLPQNILDSKLYSKLAEDRALEHILIDMRSVVASYAKTTIRTVPNFTDHTVSHMDALWVVSEQVLTQAEIQQLTPAEAFLLGTGFYLHDIGMAYAATKDGLEKIKESKEYKAFIARLPEANRTSSESEAKAVAVAVRQLHADAANELATNKIPGTDRYFFEAQTVRDAWGAICGKIASSHHWSISQLEDNFGKQQILPLDGSRKADPLYISCCLRLIDYAHINKERASSLDRAFRLPLDSESLPHWLAQENINGPVRDDNSLVYSSSQPITDVEAWWLYYEMLHGLDNEIRSVQKLLNQRKEGLKRISLSGVRGGSSPEEAAIHIPTSGFLPIEVNLRTGSIDKLVELLAGETLYGPNPMAAVRELIQNARDAVMLKAAAIGNSGNPHPVPVAITLNTNANTPILEILDHGIGMTKMVMKDYLIAIASDYWTSQFARDFPEVAEKGFQNAGKFGIGFLSVFMLGNDVSVESNRAGGERYHLSLKGVGRRGELHVKQSPEGSGTAIRIKLKLSALQGILPFEELVEVYAPTLP